MGSSQAFQDLVGHGADVGGAEVLIKVMIVI